MKLSVASQNDPAYKKSRLLFKVGKTIIKSIRSNGASQTNNLPSFEQVAKMAKDIFIAFDPHARGQLSRHSVMKAIKELGFSLSMVQEVSVCAGENARACAGARMPGGGIARLLCVLTTDMDGALVTIGYAFNHNTIVT